MPEDLLRPERLGSAVHVGGEADLDDAFLHEHEVDPARLVEREHGAKVVVGGVVGGGGGASSFTCLEQPANMTHSAAAIRTRGVVFISSILLE